MTPAAVNEELRSDSPAGIDEAIGNIENLYRAVTGSNPPTGDGPYSPIPVEKDPSQYVEQQLDRLLSMLGPARNFAVASAAWAPPMSVWDDDKEFLICLDIPGVSRRDVEVTASENILSVAGRRPVPASNGHRLRANERPAGAFSRKVLLPPASARSEGTTPISAQLREGVLEIRISKEGTRAEKPRSIPVG